MDGSVGALSALGYALAEAARREGRLLVVSAFRHPDYMAELATGGTPSVPDVARYTDATLRTVVDAVIAEEGPAVAGVPSRCRRCAGTRPRSWWTGPGMPIFS